MTSLLWLFVAAMFGLSIVGLMFLPVRRGYERRVIRLAQASFWCMTGCIVGSIVSLAVEWYK